MTVKELRDLLQDVDGDRIVILASDSEGNHYSPLADCYDSYAFRSTNIYSGDVGLEQLTQGDIDAGYTEDDVVHGKPALVLFPIR